jgi:hypothetical protein
MAQRRFAVGILKWGAALHFRGVPECGTRLSLDADLCS